MERYSITADYVKHNRFYIVRGTTLNTRYIFIIK